MAEKSKRHGYEVFPKFKFPSSSCLTVCLEIHDIVVSPNNQVQMADAFKHWSTHFKKTVEETF